LQDDTQTEIGSTPTIICRICGADQVVGVISAPDWTPLLKCSECGALNEIPER
jgi:uncharacterized Zn finger protein